MIRVQCFAANDGQDWLKSVLGELEAKPLAEAIEDTRQFWMEDDGPQVFVFSDQATGQTLATMVRGEEPELCLTTYCDGTVEKHRCRYVLDADGGYDRTEVEELQSV